MTSPGRSAAAPLALALLCPTRLVTRLPGLVAGVSRDHPVTVVHPLSATEAIATVSPVCTGVRFVPAPSGSRQGMARYLVQGLSRVGAGHLVAHLLTEESDLPQVLAEAERYRDQRERAGWTLSRVQPALRLSDTATLPLLLVTADSSSEVTQQYLQRLRGMDVGADPIWAEILADAALAASSPEVEYVEPGPGGLEVTIRLNTPGIRGSGVPRWQLDVALEGTGGAVVASSPGTAPSPRQSVTARTPILDLLHAEVSPPAHLSGDFRVVIRAVAADGTVLRKKLPHGTPGAWCSRSPVGGGARRWQVTPGRTGDVYLTLAADTGRAGRVRWAARMISKDAALVLRSRGREAMAWRRVLRWVTAPFFWGRQVWLVGERYDTASDNGAHLFGHLARVPRRRRTVRYLIDPGSPQRAVVAQHGRVVAHSGWRHRLLMLHADVIIGAYSLHYLIPRQWDADDYLRILAWRVGAVRVYLKHGVHVSPAGLRRGSTGLDMVVAALPQEAAALAHSSGYRDQLVVTGLPRFDALQASPASRTVLFMSTWRQYLVPPPFADTRESAEPFEGSTYQRFVVALLQSARLHRLLDEHDYRFVMLPHYNMATPFGLLPPSGSDRVQVADPRRVSVQEQLISCDAFITDYSSVHFDVAYLGTPIVYSRFDEAEYLDKQAASSWFDYPSQGFGPVAHTLEETLDALEDLLKSGCAQPPLYADRVSTAFGHRDARNSERVTAAIEAIVKGERRAAPALGTSSLSRRSLPAPVDPPRPGPGN